MIRAACCEALVLRDLGDTGSQFDRAFLTGVTIIVVVILWLPAVFV